jgi:hypothetical protein
MATDGAQQMYFVKADGAFGQGLGQAQVCTPLNWTQGPASSMAWHFANGPQMGTETARTWLMQ